MPLPKKQRFNNADYYTLQTHISHTNLAMDGMTDPYNDRNSHHLSNRDTTTKIHDILSTEPLSHITPVPPLGKPTVKKMFHLLDLLAAGLS